MKLAIFDKDGTLVAPKSSAKFVQHPEDQMLLPGVAEGIAALAADGWAIAIASNQGGVAAGHKSLNDAIAEMQYCLSLLPQIEVAFFCPDFEDNDYVYVHRNGNTKQFDNGGKFGGMRKPQPGMIRCLDEYMAASEILFVGDRPEDQQAAKSAGVAFQWADEWRAQYTA
jgi:D-glycero-D-manno-heptose 1,7-bisphosphate phosphatase